MAPSLDLRDLHPLEARVLRDLAPDAAVSPTNLAETLSLVIGQVNQAVSRLVARGFLSEAGRETRVYFELTDTGRAYAELGLPEERILNALASGGPQTMNSLREATSLEQREIGSAYGVLSKAGVLAMDEGKRISPTGTEPPQEIATLRGLISRAIDDGELAESNLDAAQQQVMRNASKKRAASGVPFRLIEREEVRYHLTQDGVAARDALPDDAGEDEVGAVTPELLRNGGWRGKRFRRFSVDAPASRLAIGRRNAYGSFLEWVKDKLVALGFEEFDGPLVETEFWNSDALFMPQFHAARDIHDVYYVADPTHAKEIEQPYLDNVASAHENGWTTGSRGWSYAFDRDFTRRLILRSQGTVMSAKTLHKAVVPGKYFGILRCFRYDQVDATHLSDFYQTEGIVLGEEVNLRTLLGLLKMFAEEVAGAEEVRYVPGYFPFTEPSVEVHIKHPRLGWFELGGSGIFRPEVTEPMGIHVPVLAWGLGIDRMALMQLGLNDLRELFSHSLEDVRMRRRD